MPNNFKEFNSLNPIWKHFLRDQQGETAQCKVNDCKKVLKITGCSTKGLHAHLQNIHKLSVKNVSHELELPPKDQPGAKKIKISNYFQPTLTKEEKFSEIMARMTAKDGISFNTICKSIDIRAGSVARRFLMYQNHKILSEKW